MPGGAGWHAALMPDYNRRGHRGVVGGGGGRRAGAAGGAVARPAIAAGAGSGGCRSRWRPGAGGQRRPVPGARARHPQLVRGRRDLHLPAAAGARGRLRPRWWPPRGRGGLVSHFQALDQPHLQPRAVGAGHDAVRHACWWPCRPRLARPAWRRGAAAGRRDAVLGPVLLAQRGAGDSGAAPQARRAAAAMAGARSATSAGWAWPTPAAPVAGHAAVLDPGASSGPAC
jgi:hypothetical protein